MAAAFFFLACAQPPPEADAVRLSGESMGTTYQVTLAAPPLAPAERAALQTEIDELLSRISRLTSAYDPDSEVSRFNRHRGAAPFPVSAETTEIVRSALRFAEQTSGAFDPTVAPLVELWGFGPGQKREGVPSDPEIAQALRSVGFQHLEVIQDPPSLRKDIPDLRLDLNAIVPGYAVDQVAALLSKKGFTDFLVELGGELFAAGLNPQGARWQVGIELPDPASPPGARLSAVIPISNAAVADSGSYRKYFVRDGKRFSHLIDPRTGRPVTHLLASATVLAPTCMEADAAATALMALGPQEGLAWFRGHPGWEALLLIGREDGGQGDAVPGAGPSSSRGGGGGFAQVTTKGFPPVTPAAAAP